MMIAHSQDAARRFRLFFGTAFELVEGSMDAGNYQNLLRTVSERERWHGQERPERSESRSNSPVCIRGRNTASVS